MPKAQIETIEALIEALQAREAALTADLVAANCEQTRGRILEVRRVIAACRAPDPIPESQRVGSLGY